jgi:hypothetical protein
MDRTGERSVQSALGVEEYCRTLNLFRHKWTSDLLYAASDDDPVPSFIEGNTWTFAGKVIEATSISCGFYQDAKATSLELMVLYKIDSDSADRAMNTAYKNEVIIFSAWPFTYIPFSPELGDGPDILLYPSYRLSQTQNTLAALVDNAVQDEIAQDRMRGDQSEPLTSEAA